MKHNRKRRVGGDGWGFDLLTLDELLRLQEEACQRCGHGESGYSYDQIAALADAILKAREKPQEMQLKIAGATTFVKVPHAK